MSRPTMRAFISYSTLDREFADRLARELRQRGVQPFIDYESIRAGEDWEDRLANEILSANILLLVLSPDSIKSKWVRREVSFAETNGIPIIPMMHRQTPLPIWIIDKQCADFQTNFNRGLEVLLLALFPEATATQQSAPTSGAVASSVPVQGPEAASASEPVAADSTATENPKPAAAPAPSPLPSSGQSSTQSDDVLRELASQLQKPLTAQELQEARLSREQRIEQEREQMAVKRRANHRIFFIEQGLRTNRGLVNLGMWCMVAGAGACVGILTQNMYWALGTVGALALLLYVFGLRKALSPIGLIFLALFSAAPVYWLMLYVPTLNYAEAVKFSLPLLGDRTVYLFREILAGMIISAVITGGFMLLEQAENEKDRFENQLSGRYESAFLVGAVFGFCGLLGWALAGLLVAFDWGFGFVPNLGYISLSLLIGYVPATLTIIGFTLSLILIGTAAREKTLVERAALHVVQLAEWKEEAEAKKDSVAATSAAG